jgi:hypothetical protein
MKVRAQIGMVLNLDKCIGCGEAPPTPALPAQGEGGIQCRTCRKES